MDNNNHQFMFIPFLLCFTLFIATASSASCPINLSYVETFPWNTSTCRDPIDTQHCCQSLLSLVGIGLAKHLKETQLFQFSNENISSACLHDFKLKLSSLKIQPSLVHTCFPNSTQFVTNTSSCAGISNITNWKQKVGMISPLDTSCNGDLKDDTNCSICTDACFKVASQLTDIDPKNSTKCFFFSTLYATGIVNQFGPTDPAAAACLLGVPLSSKGSSSESRLLPLASLLVLLLLSL